MKRRWKTLAWNIWPTLKTHCSVKYFGDINCTMSVDTAASILRPTNYKELVLNETIFQHDWSIVFFKYVFSYDCGNDIITQQSVKGSNIHHLTCSTTPTVCGLGLHGVTWPDNVGPPLYTYVHIIDIISRSIAANIGLKGTEIPCGGGFIYWTLRMETNLERVRERKEIRK